MLCDPPLRLLRGVGGSVTAQEQLSQAVSWTDVKGHKLTLQGIGLVVVAQDVLDALHATIR